MTQLLFIILFKISHGELYDKRHIIGLIFCIECRLVAPYLSAFATAVYDYKALLWVGLGAYRLKLAPTGVCSVSRVYIYMQ